MDPQSSTDVTWDLLWSEPASIKVSYRLGSIQDSMDYSSRCSIEGPNEAGTKSYPLWVRKAYSRNAPRGQNSQRSPGVDSPVSTDGHGSRAHPEARNKVNVLGPTAKLFADLLIPLLQMRNA